jgi:hypothetical protein
MSTGIRVRAALLGALLVPLSRGLGASTAKEQQKTACCFSNPYYAGVCEVRPSGDETCAGILAYLNNPNSVGKSYCGNTTVRGGWTQVQCKPAKGPAKLETAERLGRQLRPFGLFFLRSPRPSFDARWEARDSPGLISGFGIRALDSTADRGVGPWNGSDLLY